VVILILEINKFHIWNLYFHTLLYMSFNINNGANNYSISKSPLNNSVFTNTQGSKANPMKPSTTGSGSMFSLGRTSSSRITADSFKETIENNKYGGAKSSSERTLYLKKIAQGNINPNNTIVSYVTTDSVNKNDIKMAQRRTRNVGYAVPKKNGL
jgi:hypothetical protein